MPCGVTKTENGVVVTCDNSGTSTHTGLHSGAITFTFFGRTWSAIRVHWQGTQQTVTRFKALALGDSAL